MNTYKVNIIETLEREIYVNAEDEYDAIDIIETDYDSGELVLTAEDHTNTTIICGKVRQRIR